MWGFKKKELSSVGKNLKKLLDNKCLWKLGNERMYNGQKMEVLYCSNDNLNFSLWIDWGYFLNPFIRSIIIRFDQDISYDLFTKYDKSVLIPMIKNLIRELNEESIDNKFKKIIEKLSKISCES